MPDTTTSPAATQPDSLSDFPAMLEAEASVQSFVLMFESGFDCAQSPIKVADSSRRMWQKYRNSRLRHFAHSQ